MKLYNIHRRNQQPSNSAENSIPVRSSVHFKFISVPSTLQAWCRLTNVNDLWGIVAGVNNTYINKKKRVLVPSHNRCWCRACPGFYYCKNIFLPKSMYRAGNVFFKAFITPLFTSKAFKGKKELEVVLVAFLFLEILRKNR